MNHDMSTHPKDGNINKTVNNETVALRNSKYTSNINNYARQYLFLEYTWKLRLVKNYVRFRFWSKIFLLRRAILLTHEIDGTNIHPCHAKNCVKMCVWEFNDTYVISKCMYLHVLLNMYGNYLCCKGNANVPWNRATCLGRHVCRTKLPPNIL